MTKNLLVDIKDDIEFLLSFVPARKPEDVEEGLGPMFYITGTYEGDIEIAKRIQSICEKYDINLVENDTEEDYSEEAN